VCDFASLPLPLHIHILLTHCLAIGQNRRGICTYIAIVPTAIAVVEKCVFPDQRVSLSSECVYVLWVSVWVRIAKNRGPMGE
jgi:hypothetical protein